MSSILSNISETLGLSGYSRLPQSNRASSPGETEWETRRPGFLSRLWQATERIHFHPRYLVALAAAIFLAMCIAISRLRSTISQLEKTARNDTGPAIPDRPLILYAYYETDNAKQNLEFFLRHGIHDGGDFIFILNGDSTVKFPSGDHISFVHRNNTCFDLGAYGEVLSANNNTLLNQYKRFILMNASIRGPFLPSWSRECWSEAYLDLIDEKTKLVGMSVNCIPALPTHVQSMLLATDRTGAELLLQEDWKCFENMHDAVDGEIHTTTVLQEHGYKVKALMTAFQTDKNYIDTCTHGDVLFNGTYYGLSIHPYETMFQKANRNIFPEQLQLLTEWHDKSNYSSQPACGRRN